jgi:FKBP-type peptidyl-prolyl cis-trans isomerase
MILPPEGQQRPAAEIIFLHRPVLFRLCDGELSMRLRCVEFMTGFALLLLSGCEEPGQIVPIAPPGANIPKVSPDKAPAEAQGETLAASGTTAPATKVSAAFKPAPPTAIGETLTTERGVKYQTLKEGTGAVLARGQRAKFHYEGRLQKDNTVFDSTRSRKDPMSARIGGDPLIQGWEEGIPGMKVGEIRKLIIPPELGYGERGSSPKIPPDATLVFEVELLSIDAEE